MFSFNNSQFLLSIYSAVIIFHYIYPL